MSTLKIETPAVFEPLLTESRYKGIYGGRGGAKCLGRGTKVVSFDGTLINVEKVKTGDKLLGIDGSFRMVLSVASGFGPLYEVSQLTANNYITNGSHILALEQSNTSRSEGRYLDRESGLISVEEYIIQSDRFKANFFGFKRQADFTETNQPLDPYFFGVWLGDGDSARPAVTTADVEISSYLAEFTDSNECRLSKFGKQNNKALGYLVSRINGTKQENPITAKLRSIGVLNNKHIPNCYIVSSIEQRLKLLAGIIDTDGSVHNNCYVITQSRKQLISQIKFIADSLGFKTNLRSFNAKCGIKLCNAWKLTICGDVWRIPCKVKRKIILEGETSKNKDWRRTRVDVKPIGDGDFYGFELDGDHLFFLEDFTVTHNSHFFAETLIERCIMQKTDWVCLREVQRTLDQSVKKLLESKIQKFNVGHLFDVQHNKIKAPYGGLIIFMGMADHTADSIKSLEGFDGAWFEEAQTMSARSLKLLRPTIRKAGSEIWFSWNPEQPTDPVDLFLRGSEAPDNAIVVKSNYYDNPFFPDELEQERQQDLKNELYHAHVWLGEYDTDGTNNVYHYFDRIKHHTDRLITPQDKYLHVGQDFNIGGCCSTVFIIDSGYPIAVDEFVSHDTRDLCIQLSSRYRDKHISIYPDASGQARHPNASESDIEILRMAGFNVFVNGSNPAVRDRINAFNGLLAHDKLKVNTNSCQHLAHALENQGYDKKGQPEKYDTHPSIDDRIDSAGYFIAYKYPVSGIRGISKLVGY